MENKPERLMKATYVACIHNSVGTTMFRSFFLKQDGKTFDATKKGELSCAYYVSGLLTMFGFIKSLHGTVEGTKKDLVDSGWKITASPEPGDVIVWEDMEVDGELHRHIGFFAGDDTAISNSSKFGKVAEHHWTFNDTRKIVEIYSAEGLE